MQHTGAANSATKFSKASLLRPLLTNVQIVPTLPLKFNYGLKDTHLRIAQERPPQQEFSKYHLEL
jgi:hypothetical protein